MKFSTAFNNFTSGEWSGKMLARTDVEQYVRACEKIHNMIVQMQGGAFRRTGSRYLGLISSGEIFGEQQTNLNLSDDVKLIPFTYSGANMILCCIQSSSSPMTANDWFVVDLDNTNLGIIASNILTYSGADHVAFPTSYYQSGDLLFLCSPYSGPRVLYKSGGIWGLKLITDSYVTTRPWETVPFGDIQTNGSQGTLTVTGTLTVGGTVTVVSSASIYRGALSTYQKCYIKVSDATSTGIIEVTNVGSTSSLTGLVKKLVPGASGVAFGGTATTAFEISAWGWTGLEHPNFVTGFQGRIYYGNTSFQKDTVWASRIGDIFELMEVPVVDDPYFLEFAEDNSRPFSLTPNSGKAGNIVALSAAKTLVINTDFSEIVAYGSAGALGPLDFTFESSTSFGGQPVQPVRIGNYLTFVQRGGRKVRDLVFNFDQSEYVSSDLSFVADHLLEEYVDSTTNYSYGLDYISEIHLVDGDSAVLYCKTVKGNIFCVTLDRDYKINAWSSLRIGGNPTRVMSIAGVSSNIYTNGGRCIIAVQRVINGNNTIYLEEIRQPNELDNFFMSAQYPFWSDTTEVQYMDSWQTVEVLAGETEITGLTRLAGETVQVLQAGMFIGEKVISLTGVLTLPKTYDFDFLVSFGYKFESILQPAPIEQGSQIGSSQGSYKSITEAYVRFWKSYGGKYGKPGGLCPFTSLVLSSPPSATNLPELFTGEKRVDFNSGFDRLFEMQIVQDEPFPMNILSIAVKGVTNE